MQALLVAPYRLLRGLHRLARRFFLAGLAVCLLFMLAAGCGLEGRGGPAMAWLLRLTHQDMWTEAVSFVGYELMIWAGLAWAAVAILEALTRAVLLVGAREVTGVVDAVRATNTRVNNNPVVALSVTLPGAARPVQVKKLMNLAALPRPGDRVALAVSRVDPTCAAYRRPAAPGGGIARA